MTKYVKVLIFQQFFASINKIFFWEEDWSLSYSFMKFRDFPDLSQFSRVRGLFSCVGACILCGRKGPPSGENA